MNFIFNVLVTCVFLLQSGSAFAQNQTSTVTPVSREDDLPFTIQIDLADFILPSGIQSYASAIYDDKWLLLAGRTNGVHGFSFVGNNFPPTDQNTEVFVIKPSKGFVWHKSLKEAEGITQAEIDALSVTASEFFQKDATLYLVGGYGINSATGQMETKNTLTAINVPKMIDWACHAKQKSLKKVIRQVSDPLLQVTGGFLYQAHDYDPMLLMLGQKFTGLYTTLQSGEYTKQIRPFKLVDDGKNMTVTFETPSTLSEDYRRRDLNIVPIIQNGKYAYTACSGVFTLESGVWTVPITIYPDGTSSEPNSNDANTFKQAMNNYNCPSFSLYSTRSKEMYIVLPGGLSYGYFSDGTFTTDEEIPFINQVTTIKIDKYNNYTQYLMSGQYPYIVSTGSNPGNQLLFGAEAQFFLKDETSLFSNGVIKFDAIPRKPTVIGYIVGGIMSTVPNTSSITDSTSSPYIFTVTLIPKIPS